MGTVNILLRTVEIKTDPTLKNLGRELPDNLRSVFEERFPTEREIGPEDAVRFWCRGDERAISVKYVFNGGPQVVVENIPIPDMPYGVDDAIPVGFEAGRKRLKEYSVGGDPIAIPIKTGFLSKECYLRIVKGENEFCVSYRE